MREYPHNKLADLSRRTTSGLATGLLPCRSSCVQYRALCGHFPRSKFGCGACHEHGRGSRPATTSTSEPWPVNVRRLDDPLLCLNGKRRTMSAMAFSIDHLSDPDDRADAKPKVAKNRVQFDLPSRSMDRLNVLKVKTEAASYAAAMKNALRLHKALIEQTESGSSSSSATKMAPWHRTDCSSDRRPGWLTLR